MSSVRSVLLAEDELVVALFLTDILEEYGYTVIGPCASAAAAMESADAEPPLLAVIDVTLSGDTDGIALARALKDRHQTSIIFLSGHADTSQRPEVLAIEPSAILQKPCLPEQIKEALEGALGH